MKNIPGILTCSEKIAILPKKLNCNIMRKLIALLLVAGMFAFVVIETVGRHTSNSDADASASSSSMQQPETGAARSASINGLQN